MIDGNPKDLPAKIKMLRSNHENRVNTRYPTTDRLAAFEREVSAKEPPEQLRGNTKNRFNKKSRTNAIVVTEAVALN